MNGVTVRTSRFLGWLLFVGGLILLVGFGSYQFMVDDGIPALIKTGVAAVAIGMVLLLVSVIRQRMMTARHDKYKGHLINFAVKTLIQTSVQSENPLSMC